MCPFERVKVLRPVWLHLEAGPAGAAVFACGDTMQVRDLHLPSRLRGCVQEDILSPAGRDRPSSAAFPRLSLLIQEETDLREGSPGRTGSDEASRDGGQRSVRPSETHRPCPRRRLQLLTDEFLLLKEMGGILMKVGLKVSVLLWRRETLDGDEETTSCPPPLPPSPARSGLLNADMPNA